MNAVPADALTALPPYFYFWIVSAAYQAFMSRTGPSNPGSKPIPVGAPNCLMVGAADAASPISPLRPCASHTPVHNTPTQGLTFVFSGEMESTSRGQAEDLVKRYGGCVRARARSYCARARRSKR